MGEAVWIEMTRPAVTRGHASCLFGEVFVGELDGDGAFAEGSGGASDGPVAHVAWRRRHRAGEEFSIGTFGLAARDFSP